MNGSDLSPDQWAGLGSLFFILAIALAFAGLAYEIYRSRR